MSGTNPYVPTGTIAWVDSDADRFEFNWRSAVSRPGLIVDTVRWEHYVVGTTGNDEIHVKTSSSITIQGGNGNDTVITPVNEAREMVYGDWEPPAADAPNPNISARAHRSAGGNDVAHVGNDDWVSMGPGADRVEWHPNPGGYTKPGVQFNFDPGEGDHFVFAHDDGFDVRWVKSTMLDRDTAQVKWFDIVGHSENPILDGEWLRFGMGTHGDGSPQKFTVDLDRDENVYDAVGDWLDAHDAAQHPQAHDAFMF